ncbi:hypothetical protein NKG94_51445 [Micromonospora sp. M12]
MESGWLLIAQASSVLQAAEEALSPGRVQELHAKPEQRVHCLIRRGQAEGVFRADIAADLLSSVLHHILHGAAGDVAAGRLDPVDAPNVVAEMALAVCALPGAGRMNGGLTGRCGSTVVPRRRVRGRWRTGSGRHLRLCVPGVGRR